MKLFFGFGPQESEIEKQKRLKTEAEKTPNEKAKIEKVKEESVSFKDNILQALMKSKLFSVSL